MSFNLGQYQPVKDFRTGLAGIKRIIANPCDTPFTVFVELATPAAGRLALGLLTFGMLDLIRAYFRPRGLRSGRHMGRGRKGRRGGGGIPDTAELVAKIIPGYGAAKGRVVGDGVKFLWIIDTRIQAGLYYLLLYNLGKDFIAESTTAILEFEAENCDVGGAALREGSGSGGAATGVQGFVCNIGRYFRGSVTSSPGGFGTGEGIYQCQLMNTVQVPAGAGGETTIQMGFEVVTPSRTWREFGPLVTIPAGGQKTATAEITVNGPAQIAFLINRTSATPGAGVEAAAFISGF